MDYNGQKMKFKNIAKEVKLNYKFEVHIRTRNGKLKRKKFQAGITDIEIPLSPHPKKNPELFKAKLFVGRYEKGGYWYILFNLPNHQNLSEKEMVEFVFNSYRTRWKIEEVHRHIKKEYKWESMRLLSYNRLKLLNTLLWITMDFLYSLKELKYYFIAGFPNMMVDIKKRLDKIPIFIYYRIGLVVKECFQLINRYTTNKYKRKKKRLNNVYERWLPLF